MAFFNFKSIFFWGNFLYKLKILLAFELFIDEVPFSSKKTTNKENYFESDFQTVDRDFAFIVNKDVEAKTMINLPFKADEKLVKNVQIFDVFEGETIGNDKKSLAIKVTLQASDRTLNETEIQDVSKKIVDLIQQKTAGVVRS